MTREEALDVLSLAKWASLDAGFQLQAMELERAEHWIATWPLDILRAEGLSEFRRFRKLRIIHSPRSNRTTLLIIKLMLAVGKREHSSN